MPCRPGERFVLLERPAAAPQAGPKEVDALVAKLGEVLQLSAQHRAPRGTKHPGPGSARDRAAPYSPRCPSAAGIGGGCGAPVQPPPAPRHDGSGPRVAKQLCGRGWLRSAARRRKEQRQQRRQQQQQRAADGPADGQADEEDDDDPHRLLQQLILSGNLIKEAVRRLQLAVAASSSSSSSSASSCSAASGGDGEALRALQ
ncbi:GSK-3-binding protein-like [Oxyura jamaicensis]|uniref:GSK-3-binding protein-like n=1 Tax=Oxyura jamaicensis TaxID=8884 RepID=UPI0015A67711|nr:GSK-3-binding protein-like [Oxyura jamaicensis]